jgi:hypothetical protein
MDKLNGAVRSHGKTEVARILAEVPRGPWGDWKRYIRYDMNHIYLSTSFCIILHLCIILYHSVYMYVCQLYQCIFLYLSLSLFIAIHPSLSLSDGKQWPIAE